MKLPIKKQYFDQIKNGQKFHERRDAHITFVCEETGETITKNVLDVYMRPNKKPIPGILEDDSVIVFYLEGEE